MAVLILLLVELFLQGAARLVPDRSGWWREGARHRVLALGDSHTWGSGVGRANAYPGQLQRALDEREPGVYSVINRGLPGMSTTQLRHRFALMLSRYRPDAVVIWCGANNLWNHAERDRTTTPLMLQLDGLLSRLRTYRLVRVFLHDWPLERSARERTADDGAWELENRDGLGAPEQQFTVRHDGVIETVTHRRGPDDTTSLYERTLDDLVSMTGIARAAGVDLVLITYPVGVGSFAVTNRAIREAGRRGGVPVVESPAALQRIPVEERSWEWALHPDARLYGEVADDLVPLVAASRGEPDHATSSGCPATLDPVVSGYGSPGPYGVDRERFENPDWPGQDVFVFTPRGAREPAPLVVLAHADGQPDPAAYLGLIRHIVGRGSAVSFPTHQVESRRFQDRYAALRAGVRAAVDAYPGRFDPGRIGLVGHSYGAGALPHLAHHLLSEEGWGAEGAFLLSMAPWYAFGLEGRDFGALTQLKALFLVFEDDKVTDHRIAIAQRERLGDGIESDHLMLRTDRRGDCVLLASHAVPQTGGRWGRNDAYDQRAVFRLLDALSEYAFHGDPEARRVALGGGNPAQISMGRWRDGTPVRPLAWSEIPVPAKPSSEYLFPIDAKADWRRHPEPSL